MGTLYLVRHGQASFGAADYDCLSELGTRQCHALGRWFAGRSIGFEAVLCGTLLRHRQSLAAVEDGYAQAASTQGGASGPDTGRREARDEDPQEGVDPHDIALPSALPWPGLNEYDSEALISTVHEGPLPASRSPETYRAHFRLLKQAMGLWMAGSTQPPGMPSWRDFQAGVVAALDHVRGSCSGDVLLVSSGGPIATAVGWVLGAPPGAVVELNLRIRNSALTEFAFSPKRHLLLSFNHLPHLQAPEHAGWTTYA